MHSKLSLARQTFAAALFAAAAAGAVAVDSLPLTPLSEIVREEQARTAIVQMQTYRWELDALSRALPPEDQRYANAYQLVSRGETLIHRMRSAHPGELPAIRAEYEANRAQLDRALGRNTVNG